jgi:hypothetical protein
MTALINFFLLFPPPPPRFIPLDSPSCDYSSSILTSLGTPGVLSKIENIITLYVVSNNNMPMYLI